MSDQEGTPSKNPRLEIPGSDCKNAPSTPSRQADDVAPASPLQLAEHRSPISNLSTSPDDRSPILSPSRLPDIKITPPTPLRHADYKSSSSTSVGQAHSDSTSASSRHPLEDSLTTTPVKLKLSPTWCGESAHFKDTANEPSAFPVMEQDVDMKDADKLSPSKLSGSPKSPVKYPLTKWFRELGKGLISFSDKLARRAKKKEQEQEPEPEPESKPELKQKTEEHKWVYRSTYKTFFREEKKSEDFETVFLPLHSTQTMSAKFPDIFCFVVSADKLKKVPENVRQNLGYCVTYKRSSSSVCPKSGSFHVCNMCPNNYACNCSFKVEYEGNKWCAHIHVAHAKNLAVYGEEACLLILDNYKNLTEKRHIRAMIQGHTKMKEIPVPNMYMEMFRDLVRSERYHVKVNVEISKENCMCIAAKICVHCKACWCRYSCTCDDYWLYRQVCEHIHNVAMQVEDQDISIEKKFSFDDFRESEQIFNDKPSTADELIEQRMMFEHRKGNDFMVKIVEQDQKWEVTSLERPKIEGGYVSVEAEWRSSCICEKGESTKAGKCLLCKICSFHYSCTCSTINKDAVSICRHMHAVERFRQPKPTDEELSRKKQLKYCEAVITRIEEKLKNNSNILIRKPVGLVKRCPQNPTPTSSSATSQQEN